jgi:hypothetical protein
MTLWPKHVTHWVSINQVDTDLAHEFVVMGVIRRDSRTFSIPLQHCLTPFVYTAGPSKAIPRMLFLARPVNIPVYYNTDGLTLYQSLYLGTKSDK